MNSVPFTYFRTSVVVIINGPERQTQRQRCASYVAIRRYREKREAYVAAEAEAAAAEAKAAPPRSLLAIRPQSLLVRAP